MKSRTVYAEGRRSVYKLAVYFLVVTFFIVSYLAPDFNFTLKKRTGFMKHDFYAAARGLAQSADKSSDFCKNIIDHKEFKLLAEIDPHGAVHILKMAFDTMNSSDAWACAMAFIQTDAARALASGVRPEVLIEPLVAAMKKMTDSKDREAFGMFIPHTKAGRLLNANYPIAPFIIKLSLA